MSVQHPSKLSGGFNAGVVIVAVIGIAIAVNVLSTQLFGRLDLTEYGVNSLSEHSEDLVASLEDLEVKVYISPDLPEHIDGDVPGQKIVLRDVVQKFRDRLEEYRVASNGRLKLTYVEATKKGGSVVEQAERAGLTPFQNEEAEVKDGRLEFKRYALGALFSYQNVTEVFPWAREPAFFEFEISRILSRLKDKAEHVVLMEDVLGAGEGLAGAVARCDAALSKAKPKEGNDAGNPLVFLNPEKSKEQLDSYRAGLASIRAACDFTKALTVATDVQTAREKKFIPLEKVIAIAKALGEHLEQFYTALAADEPQAQMGALQLVERLHLIANAVATEQENLEDAPGRRRIGIVCAGQSFCPFPSREPLVPETMRPMVAQNPFAQQVLPALEQWTEQINMTLASIENNLFRQNHFDIVRVDLEEELPDDLESLVVIGPSRQFSDWQLYQLDQFALGGGSVVVFLNGWDVSLANYSPQSRQDEMPRMDVTGLRKNTSNIGGLLAHWGVTPQDDLLLEPVSHDDITLVVLQRLRGMMLRGQQNFPYPLLARLNNLDTESPLMRAVGTITLPYASTLALSGAAKGLARSSDQALTSTDPQLSLEPTVLLNEARSKASAGQQHVVVATVNGDITSYFKGKAKPAKATKEGDDSAETPEEDAVPGTTKRLESGSGRILVIGSNLGLESLSVETIFEGFEPGSLVDQQQSVGVFEQVPVWRARLQNWELRIQQLMSSLQANIRFLHNVLDWSVQNDGLLEVRSKMDQRRHLEQTEDSEQSMIKAAGVIIAPLLVVLLGLANLSYQRSRRRRIAALSKA